MKTKDLVIVGTVVVAAAAMILLKQGQKAEPVGKTDAPVAAQTKPLPRLVDLGAGKCIPCKAMKPVLEDLQANYAEAFKTEFIDVWQNPDAGKQYEINLIPTQIFYGADGKELFRHEGFFAKEDILAKWKELGVVSDGKNAQR
jgi:thioredoxin 1